MPSASFVLSLTGVLNSASFVFSVTSPTAVSVVTVSFVLSFVLSVTGVLNSALASVELLFSFTVSALATA